MYIQRFNVWVGWFCLFLVAGCTIVPLQPEGISTEKNETASGAEEPEAFLFPSYLCPTGLSMVSQQRYPTPPLFIVELEGKQSLESLKNYYALVIKEHSWYVRAYQSQTNAFLLQASIGYNSIEVRAVQGAGVVSVFLMMDLGLVD